MNHSLFRVGNQGHSSNITPMGYLSFFLFGTFCNNTFSSAVISAGGNPSFGSQNLHKVLFLHRGHTLLKDLGICGRDKLPRHGCRSGETHLLMGEIDRPSTGRVEPVRGCLNNPSRLEWTTLTSLTAPLAALRSSMKTKERIDLS
jgi:hypothetical protein